MRKIIYIFLLVVAAACSGSSDENRAAESAKAYYDSLYAGRADFFMRGYIYSDSLPSKYFDERVDNAKMFVSQQEEEHRGVVSVRVSRTEMIDSLNMADVFLIFCYGDSTNEEVVVPMIESGGRWLMR